MARLVARLGGGAVGVASAVVVCPYWTGAPWFEPLARLARHMQVSERQLQRRFQDVLGLTPKRYAQQIRLAETIALADAARTPAWADLAVANGYCDQSHLIRDCQKLTGVSPARLHALRTAS